MLAEMPSAPPILLLHVLLLYSGGALFLLGISKTFKHLPGVIMSVIGALLIFMSFVCFNMECAEQNPKKPHPPTLEEMEQAALQAATKPVLHRMGGAGCLEGNGEGQSTDQELDDILEKKWVEEQVQPKKKKEETPKESSGKQRKYNDN